MNTTAQTFTLAEVVAATDNFKPRSVLGEGGFGKVYKKVLQGVLGKGSADHPNLVKLIDYCVAAEQRLLVYEFIPLGSLDRHLFDLKCSNILLSSNFGLAKLLEWFSWKAFDTTRRKKEQYLVAWASGTHHHMADCIAHYVDQSISQLTYILLNARKLDYLARPLFKDRTKFFLMADPELEGQHPRKLCFQALAISAIGLAISEIVVALDFLANPKHELGTCPSLPRGSS
uniref:Protein kinase domain-containing protein n=1 Tax=Kalanchoe fedtschenkoi TaxID=63787 RepID=A0A7N0UR49_KALFE